MDKLIHTAEGALVPDRPWYLIPGTKGRVVDARRLHDEGVVNVKNGDPVLITDLCIDLGGLGTSKDAYYVLPDHPSNPGGSFVTYYIDTALEPVYD